MKYICLAIIPARGGSKRIFRKNIKEFLSKPIIEYSIQSALQSKCFQEVMVSTDDSEIADVSIKSGAKVPFYRSKKNSNDTAGLSDVVKEVITEYAKRDILFHYCCCILPTAAFIKPEIIQSSFKMLENRNDVDAVVPVVRYSYPIQRAFVIKEGRLAMLWPENYQKRSQDLETTYHDCGQFYWLNVKSFLKHKKLFMDNTVSLELPEIMVQDIDTEEDWKIAELKYKLLYKIE